MRNQLPRCRIIMYCIHRRRLLCCIILLLNVSIIIIMFIRLLIVIINSNISSIIMSITSSSYISTLPHRLHIRMFRHHRLRHCHRIVFILHDST